MIRTIVIDQDRITELGYLTETDVFDWMILNYVRIKSILSEDQVMVDCVPYVPITPTELLSAYPLAKSLTEDDVAKRVVALCDMGYLTMAKRTPTSIRESVLLVTDTEKTSKVYMGD